MEGVCRINWFNGKNVFQFKFIGRKIGACGITYEIRDDVEIDSKSIDSAVLKLYDKYEHISDIHVLCFKPEYVKLEDLK